MEEEFPPLEALPAEEEELPPLEGEWWDIFDRSDDNLRVMDFFEDIERKWRTNDPTLRRNLGLYLKKNLPMR